ncbi:sulfatase [Candidatus Nanosalina sp. VS9-1]|uniref:sulfatase n=1 Tax=Candidatus Nanosalina sp. VS9-1 TaxID=3388566 RepID=UPI0039DF4D97
MSDERYNIVLVVMDTARAQNFSCYGYEKKTTPFLDELAEENVVYENAYSQANWTLSSHASMFSGQYLSEHKADLDKNIEGLNVLQDDLKEKGYTNLAAVNVGYLSSSTGVDTFFDRHEFMNEGVDLDDNSIFEKAKEMRNVPKLEKYWKLGKEALLGGNFRDLFEAGFFVLKKASMRIDSGAKKTNEKAFEYLEDLDDEPFFMFLNYAEPHAPFKPPFPYSHKYLDRKLRYKSIFEADHENMKPYLDSRKEPDEEMMDIKESLYDGSISYLDYRLENLYKTIRGKHPNTIFIFTSDHGEYLYAHKRPNHLVGLHEEVTHVPLIEVFPEEVEANVEGAVELRQLRDHIIDLADGDTSTIEPVDYAISEDYGGENFPAFRDLDLTDEDRKKHSRYSVSAVNEREQLIEYSDGEREENPCRGNKAVSDSASEAIRSKVGEPSQKEDEEGKDLNVKDEKIKENLKDLGYM